MSVAVRRGSTCTGNVICTLEEGSTMFTGTVARMGRVGNCSFSSVMLSVVNGVLSTALGMLAR